MKQDDIPYKNNKCILHVVCELHVSSAHIIDVVCEQNNACDKQTFCLHAKDLLSLCTHIACMHFASN